MAVGRCCTNGASRRRDVGAGTATAPADGRRASPHFAGALFRLPHTWKSPRAGGDICRPRAPPVKPPKTSLSRAPRAGSRPDTKCGVGSKRAGRQRWHLTVTPATAARTDPISPNPATANHVAPRRLHHVPRPGAATRPLRARGARGASSRRLLPGTALRFFRASAAAGVTGAGLVSTRVPARAPRADNIIGLPFAAPPGRRPAGPGARPFSGRHVSRSRAARRGGLASTYARVAG
ncbi:hypothetical protein SETIT_9G039300v2 [Setaria italica]|uniref:Uncharacterized protein n=1 Tax=Setaria italica TaxID=4555 RepID=A0A368SEM9_SETIT|nr:hypothetical protein SETIT_9G039300v2 [Setaria italica]